MGDSLTNLQSRSVLMEQCLLKTIIAKGAIPTGLVEDYFQGLEQELYRAISGHIVSHGVVEVSLIPESLKGTLADVIDKTTVSVEHAIEVLHKHWLTRETEKILLSPCEDPYERVQYIQEKVGALALKRSGQKYEHKAELKKMVGAFEEIHKQKDGTVAGYSTYIYGIDQTISGIRKGKFYVMGGLKKTGKSRFMTYLAIKLAQQGAGVLLNSLEMSAFDLNVLLTAHITSLDSSTFDRRMSQSEMQMFQVKFPEIAAVNWCIYRDYTIPELKSRILYERQKRNIDVVFVDFVQRMRAVNFAKDRVRGIEEIAIGLADLSRDLDVAIIALSQLSGGAEDLDDNKIPDMKYFKESQGITENADCIIMLHNPKRKEIQTGGNYNPPVFLVKIDQRYGRSGHVVGMTGDLRTCKYNYVSPETTKEYLLPSKVNSRRDEF